MINPKLENKMVIREEAFDEDGNVVGVIAEKVPLTEEDKKENKSDNENS